MTNGPRRRRTAVLVGLGLMGATVARAETLDVKLGLWEVTHTTETSGTYPVDTSKLTPEQRARLEEAMKARQGTRTHTSRSCLTKEKLDKALFPTEKEDASCRRTVVSSSRTVLQEKMECTGEHKMSGEMRFEALSRERVTGTTKMSVGEGPRTMNVSSKMSARWIGADCGDVR